MEIPILPIFKLLCVTLVFSTFLRSSLSESELCHPQDKKVLLQIKKAFNDPHDLASWDPETDCCSWYGVECHKITNRVWSLEINDGELEGPIPPQVGDLPYLEFLQFKLCPNLTGPIPPAIAKLKRLRFLRISWTGISGQIPDFIGNLKNLQSISLSSNRLTGPIPSSIGSLKKLTGLLLDRNKLTGPIPHSFGKFEGKEFYLYLNRNQLSGKIPASLRETDFSYIDLSRNMLEGDASVLFGSKKSTWVLDISRNLFEFDFSNVKFAEQLTNLDISHNKIYGSLPKGLTKLSMAVFNVSYNKLCGQIPQGGDLQTRFDASAYVGNRCLCDPPLPSCNLIMEA
ncbi:hypothetical protein TIFTF001_033370 [Ficus carica]|uniref:Polygalacturonase-inhibiting protein n=1 Tax=Ficus carica TaxID=3494 RepID=A0AA88J7J5_FICCA|nr:hypothetical protein TIFTF001_033370 [Ficus carica]